MPANLLQQTTNHFTKTLLMRMRSVAQCPTPLASCKPKHNGSGVLKCFSREQDVTSLDVRSNVLRSSVGWLRMVTQLFAEPFDTTSRERYRFRTRTSRLHFDLQLHK